MEINAECSSCRATGLYSGFMEAKNEAVVCLRCNGTGCEKIQYTPFTVRKGRRNIRTVRQSRGSFIATGVGGVGRTITYGEFVKGKMP